MLYGACRSLTQTHYVTICEEQELGCRVALVALAFKPTHILSQAPRQPEEVDVVLPRPEFQVYPHMPAVPANLMFSSAAWGYGAAGGLNPEPK